MSNNELIAVILGLGLCYGIYSWGKRVGARDLAIFLVREKLVKPEVFDE